jgi:hypothetical protein
MRRTKAHVNQQYQSRGRERIFHVAVAALYPDPPGGFNIFATNDE